jgi:hypothetical protein
VELIHAPIATAQLSAHPGAALFAAAHDVLADPAALSNVVGQLRPDARVAAGGWKAPSAPWLWPLRVWVSAWQRPHVTDFTGFDQPWRLLSAHVGGLRVHEIGFGTAYIAHTTTPHSPYRRTRRPPAPAQPLPRAHPPATTTRHHATDPNHTQRPEPDRHPRPRRSMVRVDGATGHG